MSSLYVCQECDLVCENIALAPQHSAYCGRCHAKLYKNVTLNLNQALALVMTAVILFLIMNGAPLLDLNIQQIDRAATLLDASIALWNEDMHLLALLVAATTLFVPAAQLLIDLYLLGSIKLGRSLPSLGNALWGRQQLRTWAMVEVFLLGLIVSIVKLKDLAELHIGAAFWACVALILLNALLATILTHRNFWLWSRADTDFAPEDKTQALTHPINGAQAGLVTCSVCETLNTFDPATPHARARCTRCHAELHTLDQRNLGKSVAFLIAAIILYIPANLLPVMRTTSILGTQDDTIMSGVLFFLAEGSWPIALLIFVASIVIPLIKLIALSYLQWSCWRHATTTLVQRARLYRLVEIIGRWSMLDVYVVAMMVALVQFGSLATIAPGSGIFAFGAVVVLTMLSAHYFDPRFIWQSPSTSFYD